MTVPARSPVLTVGLPTLPSTTGATAMTAAPLPDGTASEQAEQWLDLVDGLQHEHDVVIVVTSAVHQRVVEAGVAFARQALDSTLLTVLPLAAGPLGAAVVAHTLWDEVEAGRLEVAGVLRLGPLLLADTLDVAVLSSVARLDLPGLTLGHQVVSYLPGRTPFLVRMSPSPVAVVRGREAEARELLAPPVHGPLRAVVMGEGPLDGPVAAWLATQPLTVPAVLDDPGELVAFWQDRAVHEVVVLPADLVAWSTGLVLHDDRSRCDWCGQLVPYAAAACTFCRQAARPEPVAPRLG